MNRKAQSTKKTGAKGKAGHSIELEDLTAERVRSIFASAEVSEPVKRRLHNLIGELFNAHGECILEETPELVKLEFEAGAFGLRYDEEKGNPNEGRAAFEKIAALAERHEPKDARLVRRLSAMLRDPKTDRGTLCQIGYIMCQLSNETDMSDTHPDVFETLARVYVREARKHLKGVRGPRARANGSAHTLRESLRELEEIAGAAR